MGLEAAIEFSTSGLGGNTGYGRTSKTTGGGHNAGGAKEFATKSKRSWGELRCKGHAQCVLRAPVNGHASGMWSRESAQTSRS